MELRETSLTARTAPPGPEKPEQARQSWVMTTHRAHVGHLGLRRLRIPEDIPVVHAWVSQEYARYWGMVGMSVDEVRAGYVDIEKRSDVFLGYLNDAPVFLLECYDPHHDVIAQHYSVEPGDRGMHVLVAPKERSLPGFTWAVFSTVMEYLFSDAATRRVVVEPDIRNRKIHALNRRAGFRYERAIELPTKTAHLAFCTRAQHEAALHRAIAEPSAGSPSAHEATVAHLTPEHWACANRSLVQKALSELSHERLLAPQLVAQEGEFGRYELVLEGGIVYRFRARVQSLEHWNIDARSLEKTHDGSRVEVDALELFLELRDLVGLAPAVLPVYLEEIASTLYAAAYKRANQTWSAADLVHADFQEIEAAMTEGHPVFIANSGRVGFDASDYLAYAPEVGAPVKLVWLAAHRRHTDFHCVDDLSYQALLSEELGPDTLDAFCRSLRAQGLDPADYLFMPVHPWQWRNKLALLFAPDLARRDLVCLGTGPDTYRAQQSIRTFFNLDHPHKRYVKTALSVLNMGFMRGLSADYMRATPAINQWVDELIASDATFARMGFGILREAASVGYRNPYLEAATPKGSPYRKMLAALWRESPVPHLAPGQRLMTMAALLHKDKDGVALLPQLIQASGLTIDDWLDRYLGVYLAPLMHCFYQHDLVFMPHGENVILLLDENVPVKAFLKDIAEEAAVMDATRPLPENVERLRVSISEEVKILSIFTDIFDGILRYVAQILLDQAGYAETRFWGRVAACVQEYDRAHPELADKLARYDLFAPEFPHSCLNRLQLRNNLQMVDLADPEKNLRFAGTLANPIARFCE